MGWIIGGFIVLIIAVIGAWDAYRWTQATEIANYWLICPDCGLDIKPGQRVNQTIVGKVHYYH